MKLLLQPCVTIELHKEKATGNDAEYSSFCGIDSAGDRVGLAFFNEACALLDKHKLVNFNISYKRAQSVANLVVNKFSFPSSNLVTEAVSDSKPLFREDMPAGTKANQRTEIFIIY